MNPDPSSDSGLGVFSQGDSYVDALSNEISANCGMQLYSDLSGFDGTQRRGWDVYKSGTNATLNFDYNNNITGQLPISGQTVLQLDAVNNLMNVSNNTLTWLHGSNLYESATNLLKTNGNFIVGGLTASKAIITNTNSQLVSSVTTSTELGYVSGVTSAIQPQINNKVNRSGDTMTGTLSSSLVGSASSLNFAISGSGNVGIYSSAANHLSLATNNANRIDIDNSGNVIIVNFVGNAGVVKNDNTGKLFSTTIVGSDIASSTIPNSKLSEASSSSTPSFLVQRDASSNFSTNMITILGTTTNATDVATKQYVDNQVSLGLTIHSPVLVVSTSPISSPPSGGTTTVIDGITLADGNRVL